MNAQLPAHLLRYQSRDLGTALSQNLGAASPPYVSIAGGRFTLIDAAGNEQPVATFDPQIGVYLDACITDVGDHISRVFYKEAYDPSAQAFTPPNCWSDNGVGPSVSCSEPQSSTCAACQWAVWGSATSAQGKAIPACGMYQKTALLIPTCPDVMFLLRVPPNSHKNLRAYNELSKRSGVDISNVITRIYFDRTTQGTLLFTAVSFIDEAIAQKREAAYVEKKTDAIVGRNDVARPVLVAPAAQPQLAAPNTTGKAPLLSTQAGTAMSVQPAPAAALQTMMPTTAPATPMFQPPSVTSTPQTHTAPQGGAAPTASPSNGAAPSGPPQRRRRRTSAEIQAANAAPAAQSASSSNAPTAQSASQAPFPHSTAPGSLPGQTDFGFGMSNEQPAAANPEVQQALDGFFGAA